MAEYVCPVCGKKTRRDLIFFLEHTQAHMIELVKQKHPEWVDRDGLCRPCVDYFQKSLKGKRKK
jgi:hypothetical protein